ncbi:MAG: HAMP domain-containing protein [Anaerolineales bacterium]|nr:HAMP domain-containing protein [Anaerolineales bacterium]
MKAEAAGGHRALSAGRARRAGGRRLGAYLFGILAASALTVALAVAVLRPPLNDVLFLALLFAITGGGSALIGLVSHRLGWWRRFRSLAQTLTLGYVIAAALTLLNVWLTARMMFLNAHDLTLAGLLLVFAGGISVSFGYFVSASITHTLRAMSDAAGRLAEGDFGVRVDVPGQDEVAHLARSFNTMAARLERADADQRALEAARRDLVAWASHDLRTPLASLRAMLHALADGVVSDPPGVARYLQQSQAEVSRMSALIDDLFELAQMDAGSLALRAEASALSDLISDTLAAFGARAQARQVTLTGAIAPGVDPVWMASDKISRVLGNLVENAIRHTPPGGRIELSAVARPGEVLVTVRDSGEGIPPADLPRVFERFYRGDAARTRAEARAGALSGGAGLGLAIARGLVEAHGGRIWVESPPGQGTALCFTLPRPA